VIEQIQAAAKVSGALTPETIVLEDGDRGRIECQAVVGQFYYGYQLNSRGARVPVRSAPVTVLRVSNPDLVETLETHEHPAIPEGWICEFQGRRYRVTRSAADELSFDFEIMAGVS
jgi:hypothetical protein